MSFGPVVRRRLIRCESSPRRHTGRVPGRRDGSAGCGASERLGVDYLLVGTVDCWPGDPRAGEYPGLVPPEPDSGFALVADDGDGNRLYRLTACTTG
jgi:hypothetical protein